MLGYVINTKAGAITYNLFHHKSIAIAILFTRLFAHNEVLQLTGSILFAHATFDRILGYGLKYFKGFKYMHLGDLN